MLECSSHSVSVRLLRTGAHLFICISVDRLGGLRRHLDPVFGLNADRFLCGRLGGTGSGKLRSRLTIIVFGALAGTVL